MKKLWIVLVMVGIALLFGMQSVSQAEPYIEVVIIDSTAGGDPTLWPKVVVSSGTGKASFDGAVGVWDVNVVTGLTYPFGGSTPANPFLDLFSLNATSTGHEWFDRESGRGI